MSACRSCLVLAACNLGGGEGKSDSKAEQAKGDAPSKAGGGDTKAVASPEQQSYPLGAITPIADGCATAAVILAQAPNSVGDSYGWPWTKQAMLANQQFKVVNGAPSAPAEVSFELHHASDKYSGSWVIVGKCKDGGTCNRLAAMYKAVVPSSTPQPVCGKLPMDLGPTTMKKPISGWGGFGGDPKSALPAASDVVGLCARLSACTIALDPGKSSTVGLDCQKAPSKFKTACARNYPCAEVKACMDR